MCFHLLSNSDLVRCITTVKQYVTIDTGYSCNHSAGKVKFTNTPPPQTDSVHCSELECDGPALHYEIGNMIDRVSAALTRCCYYDTLENNLKSYGLSVYKYQTALTYLGR